ncbi:hypothetical protein D3C87_1380260 [compost metagenome]
MQTIGLNRIISRQFEQRVEHDFNAGLGRFIGFEKFSVASEQKPAHPGFQVDRQLDRLVSVIDHPVCVLDPLDRREQIGNQRDKKNSTDGANTQREADVAAQELAESLFINQRR